jgi:tight adherence protein B
MLFPALVFVGVIAIVVGAYWLFVVRDEQTMLRRLQPETRARLGRRPGMLKPEETMSSVGTLDSILRTSRFTMAIQTFLDQGAVRMSVSVFLLASACLALASFLLGNAIGGTLIAGAILAPVGGSLPYLYVRRARTKRVRKFEEQFPEAIDLVARALRAGHALPTGLGMVADELKAPVGTEFRILYDEQNFGLTLPDAMRNFARRVPVLDAKFFVTAVLTQRETGGNLAEVLDNLGAVIRDRFKVKRQVRVLSAHGRITGWVLAALPPTLAVATFVLNPNHLGLLYKDPLGRQMIVVAIVLQIVGTLIIRKLVDVEY